MFWKVPFSETSKDMSEAVDVDVIYPKEEHLTKYLLQAAADMFSAQSQHSWHV